MRDQDDVPSRRTIFVVILLSVAVALVLAIAFSVLGGDGANESAHAARMLVRLG